MFPDPAGKREEIKYASHFWSRTPPPWTSKLVPSITETTGRVRAWFNLFSCKHTPLWETIDGARHASLGAWLWPRLEVELRRQQPGENIPAVTPWWMVASALVPFMAQRACGLQDAEQHQPLGCLGSQALFHISLHPLLLVKFELLRAFIIRMDGLRYKASQGHTWFDGCTSKLVPVPAKENKGRFRVWPSQAPILGFICSQWREAIVMPTRSRHNVSCLACPGQHWSTELSTWSQS